MSNWSGVVKELKRERDVVEQQLSKLNAALTAFANVYEGKTSPNMTNGKRRVSAAARRKMSLAQKARWAKSASNGAAKPKRVISAAARRKIGTAQRARWAKLKRKKAA